MDFEIREMNSEDWPEVARIYGQGIEEGTSTFDTCCPEYGDWNARHLETCRYVITSGGKLAGWCAVGPTSSKPAYSGSIEDSIYIDKAFRGRGAGRLLLEHLCRESERCGIWSIYAVIISNNATSISLHKKCGFRIIGSREKIAKDRFGVWQDTTLMERRSKIL